MNISFWSVEHAHAGCSANALAMALWHALQIEDESDERVSFTQTGFTDFSLDYALLGPLVLTEKYFGTGMDNLLSIARSRSIRYDDAYNSCFSLADKNLFYYIASRQTNRDSFELTLQKLPELVEDLNDNLDYNYIDLMPGESPLVNEVLKLSDFVVINVSQNELVLQKSVKAAEQLLANNTVTKKKLRFCIGNYEANSALSIRNIVKKYPFMRSSTFYIPRNIEFMDAMSSGRMIEFFMKHSGNMAAYKGISDQKAFFDSLQNNLDYFEKEG